MRSLRFFHVWNITCIPLRTSSDFAEFAFITFSTVFVYFSLDYYCIYVHDSEASDVSAVNNYNRVKMREMQ